MHSVSEVDRESKTRLTNKQKKNIELQIEKSKVYKEFGVTKRVKRLQKRLNDSQRNVNDNDKIKFRQFQLRESEKVLKDDELFDSEYKGFLHTLEREKKVCTIAENDLNSVLLIKMKKLIHKASEINLSEIEKTKIIKEINDLEKQRFVSKIFVDNEIKSSSKYRYVKSRYLHNKDKDRKRFNEAEYKKYKFKPKLCYSSVRKNKNVQSRFMDYLKDEKKKKRRLSLPVKDIRRREIKQCKVIIPKKRIGKYTSKRGKINVVKKRLSLPNKREVTQLQRRKRYKFINRRIPKNYKKIETTEMMSDNNDEDDIIDVNVGAVSENNDCKKVVVIGLQKKNYDACLTSEMKMMRKWKKRPFH